MQTAPKMDGPETGDLLDPRVLSFFGRNDILGDGHTALNGFKVESMMPIPAGEQPSKYDSFHTYTVLFTIDGKATRPTTPWLTIFDSHPDTRFPDNDRYVILCDHATGMRLKVTLPRIED